MESVNKEVQDGAEFQLLTTEIIAEEYLSFDDNIETHEEAINTTQVDWGETTQKK